MLSFLDPPEIALIVVLILVLFGGSQLPKLAKNLGKAQNELKKGLEEGKRESDATETVEQKLKRLEELDKNSGNA
jgi:sec-independent protein translocase protein TatA